MYVYYEQIKSNIHLPFAREVAEFCMQRYGFVTRAGKPAEKLIRALLDSAGNNNKPMYYKTRFGLARVYSYQEYMKVIGIIASLHSKTNDSNVHTMTTVGDHVYRYKFIDVTPVEHKKKG